MSGLAVPNQFAGVSLKPVGAVVPAVRWVLDPCQLNGVRVSARFLAWQLQDFIVEGLGSIDGWFLTIELSVNEAMFHLEQGNSSFYAFPHSLGYTSVSDGVSKRRPTPVWRRRSDRHWPAVGQTLLPFLLQFDTSEHIVYLFGDTTKPVIAAYVDPIGTQDVEDHYDQEAGLAQ